MHTNIHLDMHTYTHTVCVILFIASPNTSQSFAWLGRSSALHPLDFEFQRRFRRTEVLRHVAACTSCLPRW